MYKVFIVALLFVLIFAFAASASQVEIIELVDRRGENDTSLLVGATEEQIKEYLPERILQSQILAFLVKFQGNSILFDAGLKDGHIVKELAKNNINPEDIKIIFITHLHPDHFGGLVNLSGNAEFVNAKIYIARPEYDYWVNELKNENVINALNLYRDKIILFEWDENIFDGVKALEAAGHTPGHTVFDVAGEILIAGDFMHFSQIQIPLPDVSVRYDLDPLKAAESRKKVLQYAAAKDMPIAGMHFGIWRVKNSDKGYEKY